LNIHDRAVDRQRCHPGRDVEVVCTFGLGGAVDVGHARKHGGLPVVRLCLVLVVRVPVEEVGEAVFGVRGLDVWLRGGFIACAELLGHAGLHISWSSAPCEERLTVGRPRIGGIEGA
jgi:hypothetical protein